MATLRPIVSAPGLLAAICAHPAVPLTALGAVLAPESLAPMYRLDGRAVSTEAAGAARIAGEVAERLRRLAGAYGAWQHFEPGPYFDLRPAQATALVRITERVGTVHVVFYVDALLPSFQAAVEVGVTRSRAARFWADDEDGPQAALVQQWQRVVHVLEEARQLLADNIGFLAANGAEEERNRWRPYWDARCVARLGSGSPPHVPTLALVTEFPLPAARQPHRLRRMRRAWEHRRRGQRPSRHRP